MSVTLVEPRPPRPWAPVLFGHGSFVRDEHGDLQYQKDGELQFIVPVSGEFLRMQPTLNSRQTWPELVHATAPISRKDQHVVFLALNIAVACYDSRIVTEIGYTIYDTSERYFGARIGRWKPSFAPGCEAPLDRGRHIMRFAISNHYIVSDTADHHPGSCARANHTAQPYDFAFRRSISVPRSKVRETLENAFAQAAHRNLSPAAVRQGKQRRVVLLGWGPDLHPEAAKTSWYAGGRVLEFWDLGQHPLVRRRFPGVENTPPRFTECLDAFGITHRVCGLEIGCNAGNASVYTVRLLIALCHLTQEQREVVNAGGNLDMLAIAPGLECVLARVNRPPGMPQPPPPDEHVGYTRPPRPEVSSYRMIAFPEQQ
ncbi:hypothetical protein F5X96DRAFT_642459 [Biscogniauxia mediterranea]|nr:hypothetical protein F5X96DRAFT_642459 [Biscogniauxia mediterranea]